MDMDGTLLDQNNHILPETKACLLKLQEQGIRLVLASGRSYVKLLPYAEELQMEQYGGFLIEVNGTAIYHLQDHKRDVLAQIELNQIHEIFHYFMKWNVEIIGQYDDGMFDYIPPMMMEEKQLYKQAHNMGDDVPLCAGAFQFIAGNTGYPYLTYINEPEDIKRSINKVSVTYHAEVLHDIVKQAKHDLKNSYWVGLTSPRWLEIMILGVTKATGLSYIAKVTGISLHEMIAFGDGENDIEMLCEVGIGVAMENALDNVKQQADEVTADHNSNGIAHTLKKYFTI